MADDGRSSGGMRAEVLGEARRMVAAEGAPAVTIQAVAEAAGVSKGGLLHHFPSKRSLLDELFAELLEEFSERITARMNRDPRSEGRFTRAYVSVLLEQVADPGEPSLWALGVCVLTDQLLRERWKVWYDCQLEKHRETDGGTGCRIARCSADGIWLARFLGTGGGEPASLRDRLFELADGG